MSGKTVAVFCTHGGGGFGRVKSDIEKLCPASRVTECLEAYGNGGSKAEQDLSKSVIFPIGEKNDAYAKYFIGQSYLKMLTTTGVGIANVTFEPGCRNNWHIHHKGGQILLVTGGRGYYQEWGKEPQELHPGDVVNIPPEVKHWHGAAKDSWFVHLAVEVPAKDGSNEWLEPVDEETYGRLK